MPLTFYIDSAPVTASVLVNVFNKSCGDRKGLTLVSNTVHYKGYRFLTRVKFTPKAGEGGEERRKPSFIQLQVRPEILGKQEKDIHRHPICAANIAEACPVAKVCAGRGRLPGHHDILSCKWCSYWRDFAATAHIFSLVWSQHWKGNKTTAWTWSCIGLSQKHQLSRSYGRTKPAFGEFSGPYCSLVKWERGKKPALESWETRAVLFNDTVFHGL